MESLPAARGAGGKGYESLLGITGDGESAVGKAFTYLRGRLQKPLGF